jgi:hypothetical protein
MFLSLGACNSGKDKVNEPKPLYGGRVLGRLCSPMKNYE